MASEQEVWKPVTVDGEPWPYEVSNVGRVRRSKPGNNRTFVGKILKQHVIRGYPQAVLYKERGRKGRSVHLLVLEAFVGPRPDGMQANHIDGNKTNNRPENLQWVTAKENRQHALRLNIDGSQTITEGMARRIKRDAKALREKYAGISSYILANIVSGHSWKWVKTDRDWPVVYLAGPIYDKSDEEAKDWRDVVTYALQDIGIETRNPLDRDYRGMESKDGIAERIVEGDKQDIIESDVLLANCPEPSVGTSMEIIFASNLGKKVVVIVPDPQKCSPWISYHAHNVVDSLEAALELLSGRV